LNEGSVKNLLVSEMTERGGLQELEAVKERDSGYFTEMFFFHTEETILIELKQRGCATRISTGDIICYTSGVIPRKSVNGK
jgi:hypothetical protein